MNVLLALCAAPLAWGGGALVVEHLECQARLDPMGIEDPHPQLRWTLAAADPAARGLNASAYQVLVASSAEVLAKDQGDLWDSGKVADSRALHADYAGSPLRSGQNVWWKVRSWDGAGTPSDWSAAGRWMMGVLTAADWHAKWITAPASLEAGVNSTVRLRDDFVVGPKLARATMNICGLGQYELTLNGTSVTADILSPGWTEYTKTCLYDTYDITPLLHEGANAAGILLGNGMYRVAKGGRYAKFERSFGRLQAIAQIRLDYADGSTAWVGTDSQWRAGASPMTFSSIYGGEDWDARLEQRGWDKSKFDAATWLPVELSNGPGGTLKGADRAAPPIRTFEVHPPVATKQIKTNLTVYDLGQEASHIVRFTVHGRAGSMVRITPDELVMPDGSLFRNNYNGKAFSQYTLSGGGQEKYTAKFYYMGCRYFQVECIGANGAAQVPVVDSIEGVVVHSSAAPAGEFSCSNDLFNRIFTMIRWAEVSNMMSVISDCPHRERLGWLEQDHLHGPSFRYNFEMTPLVGKIIGDMSDCQLGDGLIPSTAPEYAVMSAKWRSPIEWGSSGVLLPWQEYQWTGDVAVLRRNYPMMKRYVEYVTAHAAKSIAAPGLGDWSGQGASKETAGNLIATALYYANADVLAKSARLIGDEVQAAAQEQLALKIRSAFNTAFFHPETNEYGTGSQCANAMAIALDLVEPSRRAAVLNNIVADLEKRKYELTVGEVGLEYLFQSLAATGRSDVIYTINNQSDRPGYGYQLKAGATALCETWDAHRDNSQIQFMLGHIMEWFYHDLAGIQLDPASPGFGHFIIHPAMVGALKFVKASYRSVRGTIQSEWTREGREITLRATIPPGTTATVILHGVAADSIRDGELPVRRAPGITSVDARGQETRIEAGSGSYVFHATMDAVRP